ncbi:MAG TPA: hypothetical protein VK178_02560 [Opitutaceae bacterium]|nr:hypothetical protein [Opitutaceae bacterium]HLP07018.1 hypothetical protein [Opitutaceae bacterium]
MPTQYAIDYLPFVARRGREFTRHAGTRAEAETAVMQLLLAGSRILVIRRGGAALPGRDFDQLVKEAAVRCMSGLLLASLALSPVELKTRFDLAA